MKFSEYQEDVFNWVDNAIGEAVRAALIVQAVAGSGKTTTIVEVGNRIPEEMRSVFLAFNKDIAVELEKRLPSHIEARTINSLGMRICCSHFGRVQIDGSKLYKIIKNDLEENPTYPLWKHSSMIQKIVGLVKSHGYVPNENMNGKLATDGRIMSVMDHHGIEAQCPNRVMIKWVQEVLRLSCLDIKTLDYDDQIYFPVAYDIPCPKFDCVILDEAQDVSHINRALMHKILAAQGILIAVGDSKQAIYGFRGADSSALDNLAEEFEADELPLSITYRCPREVVAEAQRYVPEIEAAPLAKDGVVSTLSEFALADFNPTDLVLCRNTAPIIEFAYKMIRSGVPCRVKGRDIGKGLVNLLKMISKGRLGTHIDTFVPQLQTWYEKEMKKARDKDDERKQESLTDRFESLQCLIEVSQAKTLKSVVSLIEELFSGKSGTMFSTVHRAKGLEADIVYILEPGLMPSKWARKPWQQDQENNLLYVAVTRAKEALYYLPKEAVKDNVTKRAATA